MEEKWKRMLFYICALLFVMVVYIGMIEQKTKERLLSASREAADMSEALQAQGEEKDTGPGGTEDTEEIRTASAGASGETEAQKENEANVVVMLQMKSNSRNLKKMVIPNKRVTLSVAPC